jgi:hypothetical protein
VHNNLGGDIRQTEFADLYKKSQLSWAAFRQLRPLFNPGGFLYSNTIAFAVRFAAKPVFEASG